jgi:RND family efflux transporter MFP subunit
VSAVLTEKHGKVSDPPHAEPAFETRASVKKAIPKPPPAKYRRWLLIASVAAVVGVAAWQVYARIAAHGKGAEAAASENGDRTGKASLGFVAGEDGKSDATPRETVPVEVVQRSHTLRLTGSLAPYAKSAVVANTSGIASKVLVDRGSVVRKDDVLVEIDPADANNKLAEGKAVVDELRARLGLGETSEPFEPENQPEVKLAIAALDLAKSNLRRASELHAGKVVSTEAYEQARTECELGMQRVGQALHQVRQSYQAYKTALVRQEMLEKTLRDTKIRAPFDGAVAEKLVEVGEQISSGMQATKVVTLVQIDRLRLSLTVPQQNIGCIQRGQTVRFEVDSFPNRTFEGKVEFITPTVNSDTRSLMVEAVVDNRSGLLRPGLFATAELQLAEQQAKIFVPATAVQRMDEVARVFVVRDGLAREQVVSLGDESQQKVEIRAGLTGNEVLVARPELVRDGARVSTGISRP